MTPIPSHPAAATEFAWLIERGQSMKQRPTVWWGGRDLGDWTTDATRAKRFASREDAQAKIDAESFPRPSNDFAVFGVAVEHGFMTSPVAATRLDEIRERVANRWPPSLDEAAYLLAEIERLRGALEDMAAMVTDAYCYKDKFETCGDPFCSESRERRDAILARSALGAPETREGEKP